VKKRIANRGGKGLPYKLAFSGKEMTGKLKAKRKESGKLGSSNPRRKPENRKGRSKDGHNRESSKKCRLNSTEEVKRGLVGNE